MKILIAFIIGSAIGGMWVQYRFSGGVLENTPRLELCQSLIEINRCYTKKQWGDVMWEKSWDCRNYEQYQDNFK